MDTTPLVIDEIEAGKAFIEQMNRYAPVKAALWLKSAEDGQRYLYVALEGLTPEKSDDAYAEVSRITSEMEDHYLNPFQVKMIGASDRVAKAIMEFYDRYPKRSPARYPGYSLGGVPIVDAYIYQRIRDNK
jgi:hypothetical protein